MFVMFANMYRFVSFFVSFLFANTLAAAPRIRALALANLKTLRQFECVTNQGVIWHNTRHLQLTKRHYTPHQNTASTTGLKEQK